MKRQTKTNSFFGKAGHGKQRKTKVGKSKVCCQTHCLLRWIIAHLCAVERLSAKKGGLIRSTAIFRLAIRVSMFSAYATNGELIWVAIALLHIANAIGIAALVALMWNPSGAVAVFLSGRVIKILSAPGRATEFDNLAISVLANIVTRFFFGL